MKETAQEVKKRLFFCELCGLRRGKVHTTQRVFITTWSNRNESAQKSNGSSQKAGNSHPSTVQKDKRNKAK